MDDLTTRVRQISQYPLASVINPDDRLLMQLGGVNGPYMSATSRVFLSSVTGFSVGIFPATHNNGLVADLLTTPLGARQGYNWYVDSNGFQRYLQNGVAGQWSMDGGALTFAISPAGSKDQQVWPFSPLLELGYDGNLKIGQQLTVARGPVLENEVVTLAYLKANTIASFAELTAADINTALGICPPDQVASQSWVNSFVCQSFQDWYTITPLVFTFQGRVGDIFLQASDITSALTAPGVYAYANTAPLGAADGRLATTAFVDGSMMDLYDQIQTDIGNLIDLSLYAPLASPQFSGIPTAPTANPGTHTGQLATTAFVQAAVTASTTGVASWNTRTGAVVLMLSDVTSVGGAPINSPNFTGTPLSMTPAPGDNSTKIATTAFVEAALTSATAGVSSFNTRTGAVILNTADVTGAGGAPLNSPGLTGVPTAPTAVLATNTTQLATCAFVQAAVAAVSGVASWNGRSGAVVMQANDVSAAGGALLAGPAFTGAPTAPTATAGTNTTQLATCAFVLAQVAAAGGVSSFNGRAGAVTLTQADVTAAGGAPLASPNFSGVPTAPTPAQTSNDDTVATTAYVRAALAGATLVSSFNSRTGAVTLQASDISAAGGALIASPTFTGVPAGPTAVPGTSSTQLATCAFVMAQIATAGGVTSFNSRAGAVTLTAADVKGAISPSVHRQVFTASGTYTPTANMIYCDIECLGGGGGGGAGNGGGTTNNNNYGGGGGAGGYSKKLATAAQIGASQVITIGTGGAGSTTSAAGVTGGNTSVGSLCVANGGQGGTYAAAPGTLPQGGLGGAPGVGDIAGSGAPGGGGQFTSAVAVSAEVSSGASTIYGGGGSAKNTSAAGANGTGYGSGGAGGQSLGSTTFAGGAGAPGIVAITEYCWG